MNSIHRNRGHNNFYIRKMQKNLRISSQGLIVIFIMFFAISCVPTKELSYFNDITDLTEPEINPRTQKLIMPFDRLYIKVFSTDPQTSQIFNSSDEIGYGVSNSVIGYLVDEAGNINFPFVGNINVISLTTAQASQKIQKAMSDYVASTSIIVKYVDNKVTVMGEVESQGVYAFTQDKLNIYEALGLGGGLTRYGNRKNIILIRNEGDKIVHYRLNLSDSKIAGKDTYYILPNDVIVVEPLKAISSSYSNITYTTILSSITTMIAVLLFTNIKF
jgi:polysaccharide export outer membrane protein